MILLNHDEKSRACFIREHRSSALYRKRPDRNKEDFRHNDPRLTRANIGFLCPYKECRIYPRTFNISSFEHILSFANISRHYTLQFQIIISCDPSFVYRNSRLLNFAFPHLHPAVVSEFELPFEANKHPGNLRNDEFNVGRSIGTG